METINNQNEAPCDHIVELRKHLASEGLDIFGEWTQSPDGWVNVHCKRCQRYYKVDLREAEPEQALAASRT